MAPELALPLEDVWELFESPRPDEGGGLGRYLPRILDRCARWFGATSATLFTLDPPTGEYHLAAHWGGGPPPEDARIVPGVGIAGTCVATLRPLRVEDPNQHPLLRGRIRAARRELASSLIVPLATTEGGCVGVLNLSRRSGKPEYIDEDLVRVASVARHIGLAVENVRLMSALDDAAREARHARNKLDAILQGLGVAVLVLDGDGRVTAMNQEALRLTGRRTHQAAPPEELVPDCRPELALALAQAAEAVRAADTYRRRVGDASGERAWSVVATPLPEGGGTVVIEDTSDHERTARELSRMARLAEIGQMTAAIAHEIRNPLTGIRSAAQMVSLAPEQATEFAEIIESEVLKLNGLCEEFLEFARPMELRRGPVRLCDLARKVVRLEQPAFQQAAVGLLVEFSAKDPIIQADPVRLEQVLRNLLQNAREACRPGGCVTLRIGEGVLSVQDDGEGMDDAARERLFTPFFTTKANGTGLGLSNVKKIVEAHRGRVRVRTAPGQGTEFEVLLPEGEAA